MTEETKEGKKSELSHSRTPHQTDDKNVKKPKLLHAIYWEDTYSSFTLSFFFFFLLFPHSLHISFLDPEADEKSGNI